MPTRLVVRLETERANAVPPPHTGPAIHAAFLRAVGGSDQKLAAGMHDDRKHKSFSLTPLLDDHDHPPTRPGVPARFEVGLLRDEDIVPVLAALAAPRRWRIGTTGYRATSVEAVASASYEELALEARVSRQWSFDLLTPVGFGTARQDGVRRSVSWPDPARVLTLLAARWNRFAGRHVALPDDIAHVVGEHLQVNGGTLRVVPHLVEPNQRTHPTGYRHGSIGTMSYEVVAANDVPVETLRALDALANFADYAGCGDRTAVGMGYVRHRPTSTPVPASHAV